MNIVDWTKVNEASGDSEKLPANGYICKITNTEDEPDKQRLKIEFEIVDGEYKGWGAKTAGNGWWKLKFYKYYTPKSMGFFKHFLSSLEKSNPGKFNCGMLKDDPNILRGLFIGLVIGYEEYEYNGEVREGMRVVDTIPGPDVRNGNFKVPELKKLEGGTNPSPVFDTAPVSAAHTSEDDLPF